MVKLRVRMGPKGQVVIPKIFREAYKLYPLHEIVIEAGEGVVRISAEKEDPIDILEKTSKEAARRRKGRKFKYDKMEFYEQYDKRAKRAGL